MGLRRHGCIQGVVQQDVGEDKSASPGNPESQAPVFPVLSSCRDRRVSCREFLSPLPGLSEETNKGVPSLPTHGLRRGLPSCAPSGAETTTKGRPPSVTSLELTALAFRRTRHVCEQHSPGELGGQMLCAVVCRRPGPRSQVPVPAVPAVDPGSRLPLPGSRRSLSPSWSLVPSPCSRRSRRARQSHSCRNTYVNGPAQEQRVF